MSISNLELKLCSGLKPKPLFKTQREYEEFRESFYQAVKPELDEQTKARTESELAARYHFVD